MQRLFGCTLLILAAATPLASTPSDPDIRRVDGKALSLVEIDSKVKRLMSLGKVPGLALALLQEGRPAYVKAYGLRNAHDQTPLEIDTVMYGASLTKLAFAYMVMQLAEERVIALDRPVAAYLPKPLPEYPKYADLGADERWKTLTARMLLDHSSGFPNFRFLNRDGKLDFKFNPGTRCAYSGEGYNLLQFVLEEGLGLDVGKEMQKRVFDRFGMTRTSMTWREDFAANMATGYDDAGTAEGHHKRESVRAAGSIDTTIADYAKFLASLMRGDGLSEGARAEMLRAQIPINSAHQFPTLDPAVDPANAGIKLSAALGAVVFEGRYGKIFYKGGHDDWTDNLAICAEEKKQCILLLSNSVRAETIFPELVDALFGATGFPWKWEYNNFGGPLR